MHWAHLEKRLSVLQPLGEDATERPHVNRRAVVLLSQEDLGRAVPVGAQLCSSRARQDALPTSDSVCHAQVHHIRPVQGPT